MRCFCWAPKAPAAGATADQTPWALMCIHGQVGLEQRLRRNYFLSLLLFLFPACSSSRQTIPWGWGRSCPPGLSRSMVSSQLSGRKIALICGTCCSLWSKYPQRGWFQVASMKSREWHLEDTVSPDPHKSERSAPAHHALFLAVLRKATALQAACAGHQMPLG